MHNDEGNVAIIFNIDELPTLESGRVELRPFDMATDAAYMYSLVCAHKYTSTDEKDFKHVMEMYAKYAWNVYADGQRIGVIYFAYWRQIDGWTMDAYRDEKVAKAIDNKVSFSKIAAQLAMQWFYGNIGSRLYTTHDVRNRAATILCKRLGFEIIKHVPVGETFFVVMEAEKGY
jgi:hypothetical protein